MNLKEYLLTSLAEECAEVAQRATKALRFGLNEIQPGQPHTNTGRLIDEVEDMLVILALMEEAGVDLRNEPAGLTNPERFEAKKAKVRRYMEYARQQGTLTD